MVGSRSTSIIHPGKMICDSKYSGNLDGALDISNTYKVACLDSFLFLYGISFQKPRTFSHCHGSSSESCVFKFPLSFGESLCPWLPRNESEANWTSRGANTACMESVLWKWSALDLAVRPGGSVCLQNRVLLIWYYTVILEFSAMPWRVWASKRWLRA